MERPSYSLSNLDALESEAIFILREVAAQFERPVILFSGGKDSITVVHLAQKAFWPAKIPFPLMQGELGQHTLYVPVEDGSPLGYIQIRSELTEWGLAEIVWALNIRREVVDFRFQRCRGRACASTGRSCACPCSGACSVTSPWRDSRGRSAR